VRGRLPVPVAAAALVLCKGVVPASALPHPRLAVRGAVLGRGELCGASRVVALARAGSRLAAVAVAGGRGSARLEVQRCGAGRWVREREVRLVRGGGRWRFPLDGLAPGDYRLRAVVRGPGSRRQAFTPFRYLRLSPPPISPPRPGAEVLDVPVRFAVQNVNRSTLACSSDGAPYVLSGRLVGPRSTLVAGGRAAAATLYLHEFTYGSSFWRFPRPEYDYAAAQARAGRVSVVVDRLGYGDSPRPPGNDVCLGAHADMAHQIVERLRRGDYQAAGAAPAAFRRIAIAGHGVGGGIAELEAYSFHDVDALVLFGWASQGYSAHAIQDGAQQGATCAQGGEPTRPGGPGAYAYFSPTPQDFRDLDFHDADPGVVDTAVAGRQRDPCGDVSSLIQELASSGLHSSEIAIPVALVFGLADAVYQPGAGSDQAGRYGASRDVTTFFVEGAGHALTLERSAPRVRGDVAGWLQGHGL
jgi:hypothetical protein